MVVDAPESTLINTEVKKSLKNSVCISMGLRFSIEIVLFYVIIKPTNTTLKKAMLQSRAIMSLHGKKKILVRAVDEKQVISL